MEGIYKVNLIPSDLSMEETVLQIANTLDNLNGIVDDVFSRVMSRIKQNTDKTNKLKERIEISKTKVEKLSGMQKAIKIFSSAKYPTSIAHEHYQSVFDLKGYQHKPQKITLSGKSQRPSSEKGIQEKLHFFHVKVAESNMKSGKDFDLDAVIENVSSVGDLLIFNTDESPYLDTKTKDKVLTYVPTVHSSVETQSSLEDAPPSIMKRNILKREIDEYMYAPGMGLVPELDMPLDLPHLPGVAGDVQYSMTGGGSIAPSAATTPLAPGTALQDVGIPDLPDLQELPDVKPEPSVLPDIPDAPTTAPIVKPPPAPAMPIPPPPPPPPPPPMEPPTNNQKEKPSAQATAAPAPVPAGDAHASLMAAIRQAGGAGRAKLRPAADDTPTKGTSGGKAAIGGDLMADLHAKLSMRRRGISGAERGAAGAAGGSVLHTLASVIPEPGDETPTQRSSSDDDWD